ncbi:MAG TPA: phosphohistidine phosphatase SixA [Blastocatellia bacterium]|nr:phosphohistidine phosphatase SixA [Blastocatellia bacterium]
MNLYLLRHGIAHPLGRKNDFTDESRTLTSPGRDRMREAAKGMRRLGIRLDLIVTSPLARALETAQIVGEVVGVEDQMIELSANLAPGGSFDALFTELKQHKPAEAVALVGHQPDLGSLAGRIIAGDSSLALPLKKGGVCCINIVETVPAFRGNLVWLLTPKQLRLIGKG